MKNSKTVVGQDETGLWMQTKKLVTILLICVCCSSGLEAHTGTLCASLKKDGTPCHGTAQTGSKFCVFHNPANQCIGTTSKGVKCKAMHSHDSKYCRFHEGQSVTK